MIYDRDNIQISELCPIQFSEPKETDFYDAQLKYCGKIYQGTPVVLQFLISEDVYNGDLLWVDIKNKNNDIIITKTCSLYELSDGYYYAMCEFNVEDLSEIQPNTFAFFEVKYTYTVQVDVFTVENITVLLSDSLWYVINPSYTRDLKTLSITHSENDWNTVFLDGENQYKFYLNVECGFIPKDERDEFETDDFIEQNMTNDTVFGDMYVVEPVTFGDNIGIPNWLRRKISRWILCDEFKIDSVEYKRTNGSKLEKTDDIENGNGIYKIDMQTINNYLQ